MKPNAKIFGIILLAVFISPLLRAQECTTFFPYQEGTVIEMTHYDRKDKQTGKTTQEIVAFESTPEGFEATMKMVHEGKKKSERFESEFTVKCENGTFKIDMQQYASPEMMEAYKEMEVEVESDELEMPLSLEVGQELEDGTMRLKASANGMPAMNMEVRLVNRKVEAEETVQTPAGEYDCYKITYEVETKMMVRMTTYSAEWYAEGVGVVKSATYNKNGKLQGYSLLTALHQPK